MTRTAINVSDDAAALAQLQRLQAQPRMEPSFKTAFHLASTAARHALERRDWKAAAALPARTPDTLPWDKYPCAEGVTWFARGLGAARTGDGAGAGAASARLAALEAATEASGETLFAHNIRVLRLAVDGWRAQASGDGAHARDLLAQAATLEAATPKHPVTPAPTLPAEEQLGDLLLQQQRPVEALAAYERALKAYPERFNSLLGAARAAHAAGDRARARDMLEHLLAITRDGPRRHQAEAWGRGLLGDGATTSGGQAAARSMRRPP